MAAGIRRPCASPARVRCLCRHDSCPRTSRRVLSVPSGPEPALLDYSRSGVGGGPVERSPARRGIPYDLSSDQTYTSARGLARRHGRGSRSPGPHGVYPQEVRGAHEIPLLGVAQFFFCWSSTSALVVASLGGGAQDGGSVECVSGADRPKGGDTHCGASHAGHLSLRG